jgi:hypothetical protein
VLARGATELVRILLPTTVSVTLGLLMFLAIDTLGRAGASIWRIVAAAPLMLLAASIGALLVTVALKWLLMGRYHPGEYPLWSPFIWRDELINTSEEQLAGPMAAEHRARHPPDPGIPPHTRRQNRTRRTVRMPQRHRVRPGHHRRRMRDQPRRARRNAPLPRPPMRTGPATLNPGSTLGPGTAMLPDTTLGAHCSVGARSIVMRGEHLPAHTRWHGAPS